MSSAIVGAINGGVIGLLVGTGLGLFHYPLFNGMYTERQRTIYTNNGAVIYMTAIGGGIGGCIGGAISGFQSSFTMNDGGVFGGLTGGTLGSFVGSTSSILIDSNK